MCVSQYYPDVPYPRFYKMMRRAVLFAFHAFIFCASIIACAAAYSCQYHGDSPWAQHGVNGLLGSQFHSKAPVAVPSVLKLNAPAMVVAKLNQTVDLEIDVSVFDSVLGGADVQLTLDADPSVLNVDGTPKIISTAKGRHAISVTAISSGMHRLVVSARIINRPQIAEQRKTIYLRAS